MTDEGADFNPYEREAKPKTTLGDFEQHVIVFGASLYRSAMFQTLVCLCQGRVEGGKRKNGGREQRKRNWEEEKAGGERTKGRRMGKKG